MASDKTIARVERLVWILIYVGLFAIVLGIASLSAHYVAAWTLVGFGAVLAVVGAILIWVRSRMSGPG